MMMMLMLMKNHTGNNNDDVDGVDDVVCVVSYCGFS
mgnify:CR=1 FL=1